MNADIKTLSERIKPNAWLTRGETGNILAASMAEVAELRAALEESEQSRRDLLDAANRAIGGGTLMGEPVIAATRAPSAPVAPIDERAEFQKAMNAARFFPRKLDFSMIKSPSGKRDEYVNTHLESCWNGWQARAALSVKAGECVWTPTADHWETGAWDSACGETWLFIDGGAPAEHGVKFCQGCGKPVAAPTPPTTGEV